MNLRAVTPIIVAAVICAAGARGLVLDEDGWWPLILSASVVLVAVAFAGALWGVLMAAQALRHRPKRSRGVVIAAIAGGVLAATPIDIGWHDGCNGHGAQVAAASVPLVLALKPESPAVAYLDSRTLMGC